MSAKDAKAFFEIVPGARGGIAKGAARGTKGKIVEFGDAVVDEVAGATRSKAAGG